jgi:hypothetical protein
MKDMFTVLDLAKRTDGRFGVEIEVEGKNLPINGKDADFDKVWVTHKEGSIDAEGMEYVFRKPLLLEEVMPALDLLEKNYQQAQSVVNESWRAGVHVHYNVQDFTPLELMTFVTTYYLLEDYLLHWCGPDRVGNHFCLRVGDAEGGFLSLLKTCKTKDWRNLNTDKIRYQALNLNALLKYGSVEFRSMRSTRDHAVIYKFVLLIDQIAKGSKKFSSPEDVIESVSRMEGGEIFVRYVMENLADEFLKIEGIDMWDTIHEIQPLAYMVDWKTFNREKINPFV